METKERLDLLEHAINLIIEAKELVDDVVADTDQEAHYEAYGKYGFDQLLNDGNPHDSSLADLVTHFSGGLDRDEIEEQDDEYWAEHAERAMLVEKGTLIRCMADSEWYFPQYKGGFEWIILEVVTEGMGELPLFKVQSQADPSITGTFSHRFFQV